MFESISFLFLFALAFTTWALLCYLHVIEDQKRELEDYNYSIELYSEKPAIRRMRHYQFKDSGPKVESYSFNMVTSFLFIFVATIGASKLLQWLEIQARNYMQLEVVQGTEEMPKSNPQEAIADLTKIPMQALEDSRSLTKTDFIAESVEFKDQLNSLEARCMEMHQLLVDLKHQPTSNDSGSQLYLSNDMKDEDVTMTVLKAPVSLATSAESVKHAPQVTRSQPTITQNVYIANSYIQINVPTFYTKRDINMNLRRQASMYTRKQSEFLQVWGKFIAGPKEQPMAAGMRVNSLLM
ncbi:uncharacterized protein LOC115634106 [Scaptodrosophila lebanonensis]|uniref:Uncharacterized protein LOC115634106 n=1 Tax=Drosophila lebanonensis TaxID=7225 RepID=A0A6J2UGG1_DROLE|nr:uncharacterized protein LOC115634106 [Scaptodrosophila lebanonensis]